MWLAFLLLHVAVARYTCACQAGYSGSECQTNIDECASQPCQNSGTCVDGINGYTCTCVQGYSGIHCQTNIDECASAPCTHSGTCNDAVNAFICTCPAEWMNATCAQCAGGGQSAVYIPDGSSTIAGAWEVPYEVFTVVAWVFIQGNTSNPFYLLYHPGESFGQDIAFGWKDGRMRASHFYETAEYITQNANIVKDCLNMWCHFVWQLMATEGESVTRHFVNGQPMATLGGITYPDGYPFMTVLDPVYIGKNLIGRIEDVAIIVRDLPGETGFQPTTHDILLMYHENIYPTGSLLAGTYVEFWLFEEQSGTTATTSLAVPFTFSGNVQWSRCLCSDPTRRGPGCGQSVHCDSNPCQHGGVCAADGSGFQCICSAHFSGEFCEIGACDSNPCQNGATCNDLGLSFTCTCPSFYYGTLCQNTPVCNSSPCQNGATCNDLTGTFTCTCPTYYYGTLCQNVPVCGSSPCQGGATCNDLTGTYTCTCPSYYYGTFCQNEPVCNSSPCQNGGVCNDQTGSFNCLCPPQYYGTLCSECKAAYMGTNCAYLRYPFDHQLAAASSMVAFLDHTGTLRTYGTPASDDLTNTGALAARMKSISYGGLSTNGVNFVYDEPLEGYINTTSLGRYQTSADFYTTAAVVQVTVSATSVQARCYLNTTGCVTCSLVTFNNKLLPGACQFSQLSPVFHAPVTTASLALLNNQTGAVHAATQTSNTLTPQVMAGPFAYVASSGQSSAQTAFCATFATNGSIACWGGCPMQLCSTIPTGGGFVQISMTANGATACALHRDGWVRCWGSDAARGDLTNYNPNNTMSFLQIAYQASSSAIVWAVRNDSRLVCWPRINTCTTATSTVVNGVGVNTDYYVGTAWCPSSPCLNGGTCNSIPGTLRFASCSCDGGFTGKYCSIPP